MYLYMLLQSAGVELRSALRNYFERTATGPLSSDAVGKNRVTGPYIDPRFLSNNLIESRHALASSSLSFKVHMFGLRILTLFRLGFFGRPWTGGWRQTLPPFRFLKTIKDIDMKLTPLIKRGEINLLLLSYLVTKAPSWIFMATILDFRTLSKR